MTDRLTVGPACRFRDHPPIASDLEATDSNGDVSRLARLFEPRHAVFGAEAITASHYVPRPQRFVRDSHELPWR
ncbi:hypothetical protein [Ensifer sp.]|jgi:dihydroorotase|uniref:hypothetical protein n=1 Tax=Ensifer sp. TaxID=1872086 RepID=UPI0039C85DCE